MGHFGEWRFIDYYESSGEGLAHYAEVLAKKGYRYGQHIGPHDIAVREWGTGKSRIETARGMGLNFTVAQNLPVMDGIEAVRQVLAAAWFDKEKCGPGLSCLWGYQREYDDRHDWTSHGADAFRYAAVGWKKPVEWKKLPPRKNLRVC